MSLTGLLQFVLWICLIMCLLVGFVDLVYVCMYWLVYVSFVCLFSLFVCLYRGVRRFGRKGRELDNVMWKTHM